MAEPRDIRDYTTLAEINRRRGKALQLQRRQAQEVLDRLRERETICRDALAARQEEDRTYAQTLIARTAAGAAVRIADLQGGRDHLDTLRQRTDGAAQELTNAVAASQEAAASCDELSRQIAANGVLVDLLESQARQWRQVLVLAAEDREEDERSESHGTTRPERV
ncbi:hypothetical protein [Xylophilus sp. GOD-11R]|uniref:hypothetical protein n=1 Tax=Xylophilus sp. GOD-11R TaxID=3089814 RepID=UPI00298C528C|nr:hypothetical protein [Xylophilus sp. GOD-11R]WPB57927.1 hypothetical protein R9X41_04585 [Xylophilus sp. GOD-11R]